MSSNKITRVLVNGPYSDGVSNYIVKFMYDMSFEEFLCDIARRYPDERANVYCDGKLAAYCWNGLVKYLYPRMEQILNREMKTVKAEGHDDFMAYYIELNERKNYDA